VSINWKHRPDEHDYDAAWSYLTLITSTSEADMRVADLCALEDLSEHPAKDILRASGLPLLPADNAHVAKDLIKVAEGQRLSPILLIHGRFGKHPLIIADGYHRVCGAYHLDENSTIPAKIV
jgi:hypothetical protein